mmetsp:Transcript_28515/g.78509  ORF Transcript_28515/g.78509 Transcript_28515/m.78509 type:complete len:213 (-) Transcript_28515:212-850(-)|eukprot:CAMPEP_0117558276 /NCGR_PEP_ID=MMETSP0784-20121206/52750_1 /TAXON_ID=39447 /ORGANISM="" /LENGTH=212 /DNA_ID=CAMNT_0005355595 /DNA_START=34 /DNA_END=672 /DNA_ORIENTATION=-
MEHLEPCKISYVQGFHVAKTDAGSRSWSWEQSEEFAAKHGGYLASLNQVRAILHVHWPLFLDTGCWAAVSSSDSEDGRDFISLKSYPLGGSLLEECPGRPLVRGDCVLFILDDIFVVLNLYAEYVSVTQLMVRARSLSGEVVAEIVVDLATRIRDLRHALGQRSRRYARAKLVVGNALLEGPDTMAIAETALVPERPEWTKSHQEKACCAVM